jgi:hypothetical protein
MTELKLLLDSGAFTGFGRDQPVDLNGYIAIGKRYQQRLAGIINLDVIPGGAGIRAADAETVERAAQESHRNLQIMQDAGLRPIPVVHQGDDLRWLEKYLKDGEPRIALSPVKRDLPAALDFLEAVFRIINDENGRPRAQVHGLGVTTAEECVNYEWSSLDSTTWALQAGYGQIALPRFLDGKPDYRYRPRKVPVTARSSIYTDHVDDLNEHRHAQLTAYLNDAGVTLEQARTDLTARWRCTIHYFLGLARAAHTDLHFVSSLHDRRMRRVLLECGATHHLLSFAQLQGKDTAVLEEYFMDDADAAESKRNRGRRPRKPRH